MKFGETHLAGRRGEEEVIEIVLHLITDVVTYILAVARSNVLPTWIKGAGNHG